jgi:hypothetical protein
MREPADLTKRRLTQARRLLAIAQSGLHYTTGAFDKERYQELLSIAQAQLADLADMNTEEVAQLFAPEEGYANPKIDVRCAVFDDAGQILLVREESGYTVTIERLLAIWDMPKHQHPPSVFHIWKLVFLGKIAASGEISGVETDAAGFFPIDALPPLSLGRILPEQIRRLAELRCEGAVEFD